MQPHLMGRASSRAGLPTSEVAIPAPSRSATATTSAAAAAAPCPASTATRRPVARTSAALASASGSGATTPGARPTELTMVAWAWGGPPGIFSCWTSWGRITAVGERLARAMRSARSITRGTCSGTVTVAR
jgi:hypothetical protein